MSRSNAILIGQYSARDSFMHTLDARVKLVLAALLMTLVLVTKSFVIYAGIVLLLCLSLYLSNMTLVEIRKNLKPLITLVLVTVLLHLLFVSHQRPYMVEFWSIGISQEVVFRALLYSVRLVIFVLISLALMATTSPSEIAEGASSLLRPLEKIKIPIGRFSLILFLAMRFIPILYREYEAIKQAQIIRGVDFGGNLHRRIKSRTALLVPLLFGSIKRADDLAIAMTVRGYRSDESPARRTIYTHASFGLRDSVCLTFCSIYLVLLFLIGGRVG